ncbi:heterogeneous nuclear ribonucleoprotein K-like [Centruroides sculpturatus]|uniref:heterogeneous nuclear ribonucleoprotein K-like n=1 Tax=Centruroides sculpturatus TaxID=218467 RepID=UPI000C6CD7CC|nr:heterogeneous nuclear ribonucleoprotein K-like [Centruroides sculpturatus]
MTDSEGSAKRMATEENEGSEISHKRARSRGRAVDVRFLLQSKNAGAIIGKGGSNINRLRKDYKASVTVPDCPGPERILSVVADIETLGEILIDIIPKLEDYIHHRTLSFDCEMRMLLHQSHAGCLIGKGGHRIKEVREKTGAHIKVYSNCCPVSTERVVQISGFPNVVIDCVKEICDIISQAPIKGPNKLYDPHNYNTYYASEYGGYSDGGGRNSGRDMGSRINRSGRGRLFGGPSSEGLLGSPRGRGRMMLPSGPRNRMGNLDTDCPEDMDLMSSMSVDNSGGQNLNGHSFRGGHTGGGGLRGFGQSQGMGGMPLRNRGAGKPGNRNMFSGSDNSEGLLGGGPGMSSEFEQDFTQDEAVCDLFGSKQGNFGGNKNSTQVTVPNELAGAIIGKGGQRIRKIRRDSGAGITIDEALPGSSDRVITISGTPQQVQMAQFLLQQSVREHSGRKF